MVINFVFCVFYCLECYSVEAVYCYPKELCQFDVEALVNSYDDDSCSETRLEIL